MLHMDWVRQKNDHFRKCVAPVYYDMHLERYSIHQFLVYSKTDAWRPTLYNIVQKMSVLVSLQFLQKLTDIYDIWHRVYWLNLQHNNLPISSILWEISQTIYQSYNIIIPQTKEYIQFIRKIGLHSIQQCWKWPHFSSIQAWSLLFHSSTAPSTNLWHKPNVSNVNHRFPQITTGL